MVASVQRTDIAIRVTVNAAYVIEHMFHTQLFGGMALKQLPELAHIKMVAVVDHGGILRRGDLFRGQSVRTHEIGRAQSELQSRGHLVCRLLLEKKKGEHANNEQKQV